MQMTGDMKQAPTQKPPCSPRAPSPSHPRPEKQELGSDTHGLLYYGAAGFRFVVIVGKFPGTR